MPCCNIAIRLLCYKQRAHFRTPMQNNGDRNASEIVNFSSTRAVVLVPSAARHYTLLPLKQRRKWSSAVGTGNWFEGSVRCSASICGHSFAPCSPFGSGPVGRVTLGGSLSCAWCPRSIVPTGKPSVSFRAFRVAAGHFQLLPCRHRTCCPDSLCAAASAHNLAHGNMETLSCC